MFNHAYINVVSNISMIYVELLYFSSLIYLPFGCYALSPFCIY